MTVTETQVLFSCGTWMSLDVSPDGTEIVFDLLGDIFLLPIEGGVPLQHEGEIVGAIGISGVKSAEDGQIAQAGADAL